MLHGIEHVGVTVPDHDQAVEFFSKAFNAEVLFSLVRKGQQPVTSDEIGAKNGLIKGTAITAISMLRLANGANVEIFEINQPKGDHFSNIAQFGISHFNVIVDDISVACAKFSNAGGTLLQGPYALTGQEEGLGNLGQFGRTPWGLLIEFEQLKSGISYDKSTGSKRWMPA